jgi:hypothetical protein
LRPPTLFLEPSGVHGAFVALGTVAAVAVFLLEARRLLRGLHHQAADRLPGAHRRRLRPRGGAGGRHRPLRLPAHRDPRHPHRLLLGELFKVYLLAYAAFRFLVEFVRGNEVVWAGLTRSQLFLIPSILLLAGYFVRLNRREPHALIALEGEP